MARRDSFNPIPPAYWDDAATTWGRQVYDKTGAHQFQYYEADLLISSILRRGTRVLEIGCGTGNSTVVHGGEVRSVVATDVSREMLIRARRRVGRKRFRSRVHYAVVDGCHLPFRDASFDAVIGRGVALSYVENPELALREIRRVLRPGGTVAMDAMNVNTPVSSSNSGKVRFRTVRSLGGRPVYIEQFNDGDLQVRRVCYLRPGSRLAKYAGRAKVFEMRPRGLGHQVVRTELMHARYFSDERLRRIASKAGLSDIAIVPLGQLYRAMMTSDAATRRFIVKNRRTLSRIMIAMRNHFKVGSGFHAMLTATRPLD